MPYRLDAQPRPHGFWDTLVDADMANNTLGWQWVAGCGAGSHRVSQPMGCGLAHLDGLVAVAFDERLHGGGDGESLPLGGGRDNFEFGGCIN
jgi:hypothetical protein